MATYSLTSSKSIVSEGNFVTITLSTTGVPNGTIVPYNVSGTNITSQDFVGGLSETSGNFVVRNNSASVTLNLSADAKTEGTEVLFLTIPGGAIGVLVDDTSKNPNVKTAIISITSNNQSIAEGDFLTFNISAVDLSIDARTMPYQVLGVSSSLVPNLIGNVTLTESITTPDLYEGTLSLNTVANVAINGIRNALLVVTPNQPYVLQVSDSVQITDYIPDTTPTITLSVDKTRVVEGQPITVTLSTKYIPSGAVYPCNIMALSANLTANDFINVTQLKVANNFPATNVSNTATLVFQTRDDGIFEQTELFYFESMGQFSSSIELIDSGNTLITPNVITGNVTVTFIEKANLELVIGGLCTGPGYYKSSEGRISDTMVLQGPSKYALEGEPILYQPFSYIIRSARPIDEWKQSINSVLHPAGLALFSEINIETSPNQVSNVTVSAYSEIEVTEYLSNLYI